MIMDSDVLAMADGLARAYGVRGAIAAATDRALAELDDGNVRVAVTWRRVLNALHRMGTTGPAPQAPAPEIAA
jgi:hypothetical protein